MKNSKNILGRSAVSMVRAVSVRSSERTPGGFIEGSIVNARTLQMLKRLESFRWFANVGHPTNATHLSMQTWAQAVESCASDVWNSVQLQVSNRFARGIRQTDHERSEEWNGISGELRKAVATVVANSIEPIAKKCSLKSDFQASVSWDLLMICLETEFSDVVPPMFFVPRLLPIYEAGQFPCCWEGPKLTEGWEGQLPNWRLLSLVQ